MPHTQDIITIIIENNLWRELGKNASLSLFSCCSKPIGPITPRSITLHFHTAFPLLEILAIFLFFRQNLIPVDEFLTKMWKTLWEV